MPFTLTTFSILYQVKPAPARIRPVEDIFAHVGPRAGQPEELPAVVVVVTTVVAKGCLRPPRIARPPRRRRILRQIFAHVSGAAAAAHPADIADRPEAGAGRQPAELPLRDVAAADE
jgi:hypothetical protein